MLGFRGTKPSIPHVVADCERTQHNIACIGGKPRRAREQTGKQHSLTIRCCLGILTNDINCYYPFKRRNNHKRVHRPLSRVGSHSLVSRSISKKSTTGLRTEDSGSSPGSHKLLYRLAEAK
jgi:hypothetical protein